MDYIATPWDAERNAAEKMRELGNADAKATPVGPDGGLDVVSTRAVAQVKHHFNPVGRADLQRLFGARAHKTDLDLLFFSRSGYSRHAVEYAYAVGMVLFKYDLEGDLKPINEVAQNLVNAQAEKKRAAERMAAARKAPLPSSDRIGQTPGKPESSQGFFEISAVIILAYGLWSFFGLGLGMDKTAGIPVGIVCGIISVAMLVRAFKRTT